MPATNITRPTACWEKEYSAVCRRGLAGRECVYIRGNVTSTGGSKTTAQGRRRSVSGRGSHRDRIAGGRLDALPKEASFCQPWVNPLQHLKKIRIFQGL